MRLSWLGAAAFLAASVALAAPSIEVKQITFGPAHHFFGYIGQCRTIPWDGSGRYIVLLRTTFQDHMPKPQEAADIVLVDTQNNYQTRVIDQTRAWNFQQGTMFYWNPSAPDRELIFNDRDVSTGKVFSVLYDIAAGRRIREFRFNDVPIANGGVCQTGGKFAAINYGRLARLRTVTGYPGAADPTAGIKHPDNDGIFVIDIATGKRNLIVSYKQMADALRSKHPDIDTHELFINHTLWNRDGDRLFFFCRADFDSKEKRVDEPMVVQSDGSGLTLMPQHFGGHPDWAAGHRMIGEFKTKDEDRQIFYDTDRREFAERIGDKGVFNNPGGDISLSPNGEWLVNGYHRKEQTLYVFYRFSDGLVIRSAPIPNGGVITGDLRLDPAPCWNRQSTAVAIPAMAPDGTRQTFVLTLTGLPAQKPADAGAATGAKQQAARLIPLNELGENKYQGFVGGLYSDGQNQPPPAHAESLKRMSSMITPLDRDGHPNPSGKIVVAGIGASVCRQIFAQLEHDGAQTPGLNPAVVFVNCALGGQDVNKIADTSDRYWQAAEKSLSARGVSPAQVQVVWYQSDDLRDSHDDFPGRPQRLKESFAEQMRLMKKHFPNVRICYHSARHTTAFMPSGEGKSKHAEPRPYYVGWAVKWLIEDQMAGKGDLAFEGNNPAAPLVAWATYFWTDADHARADGYQWNRSDNVKDGVHLTESAQKRVAKELTDFWSRDVFAKQWFAAAGDAVAKAPAQPPAKSDANPSPPKPAVTDPTQRAVIRKDAGSNDPAWIINGANKMPKLQRLLATTDGVRVIVRNLKGEQVAEIKDVFSKHSNLNELLAPGQYRLEFLDKNGQPIKLTQEVGEVLRLK